MRTCTYFLKKKAPWVGIPQIIVIWNRTDADRYHRYILLAAALMSFHAQHYSIITLFCKDTLI